MLSSITILRLWGSVHTNFASTSSFYSSQNITPNTFLRPWIIFSMIPNSSIDSRSTETHWRDPVKILYISHDARSYLLHSGQKVIVASLSMWSPTEVFIIKHFVHIRGPSPGISTPHIQHFLVFILLSKAYTVQARLPRSELISLIQ